jgi:hypothetical protein
VKAVLIDIKPGQIVAVGSKIYGRCLACRDLVRVDKWLVGSLHLCVALKEDR